MQLLRAMFFYTTALILRSKDLKCNQIKEESKLQTCLQRVTIIGLKPMHPGSSKDIRRTAEQNSRYAREYAVERYMESIRSVFEQICQQEAGERCHVRLLDLHWSN